MRMSVIRPKASTATLLLAVALVLLACSGNGAIDDPSPGTTQLAPTAAPASAPPANESPAPSPHVTATPAISEAPAQEEVPDLASYLECDEVDRRGRMIDSPFPLGSGDTPEEAAEESWQEVLLPVRGYERVFETARSVILAFRSAGKVKVALHASRDQLGLERSHDEWMIWSLRACHDNEYGADVELDPTLGVWRNFETNRIAVDFEGWAHCNMENARFLLFGRGDEIFIRDPEGRFEGELYGRYRDDAVLPDDAIDTGYRRAEDQLWLGDNGRALYVVTSDGTERWPRHRQGGPFCA